MPTFNLSGELNRLPGEIQKSNEIYDNIKQAHSNALAASKKAKKKGTEDAHFQAVQANVKALQAHQAAMRMHKDKMNRKKYDAHKAAADLHESAISYHKPKAEKSMLAKAKYIKREPDGKGGWKYHYGKPKKSSTSEKVTASDIKYEIQGKLGYGQLKNLHFETSDVSSRGKFTVTLKNRKGYRIATSEFFARNKNRYKEAAKYIKNADTIQGVVQEANDASENASSWGQAKWHTRAAEKHHEAIDTLNKLKPFDYKEDVGHHREKIEFHNQEVEDIKGSKKSMLAKASAKSEWISKKISHLIKVEGKEQKQAIAIAHSMWRARGKGAKKSMIATRIGPNLYKSSIGRAYGYGEHGKEDENGDNLHRLATMASRRAVYASKEAYQKTSMADSIYYAGDKETSRHCHHRAINSVEAEQAHIEAGKDHETAVKHNRVCAKDKTTPASLRQTYSRRADQHQSHARIHYAMAAKHHAQAGEHLKGASKKLKEGKLA